MPDCAAIIADPTRAPKPSLAINIPIKKGPTSNRTFDTTVTIVIYGNNRRFINTVITMTATIT